MHLFIHFPTRRNYRESYTKERCLCPVRYECIRRWVRESRKPTVPCDRHIHWCLFSRNYNWNHGLKSSSNYVFASMSSRISQSREILKFGKYLIEASARLKTLTMIICTSSEIITIDCHTIAIYSSINLSREYPKYLGTIVILSTYRFSFVIKRMDLSSSFFLVWYNNVNYRIIKG